jgi:hypothetical protein
MYLSSLLQEPVQFLQPEDLQQKVKRGYKKTGKRFTSAGY